MPLSLKNMLLKYILIPFVSEKGLAHGGISKIFFVMYVHIINKNLRHKFNPYSILST